VCERERERDIRGKEKFFSPRGNFLPRGTYFPGETFSREKLLRSQGNGLLGGFLH